MGHKPSFTIADCDCGFRPGQLCSGGIQESVNNETQLECYQRCIHTENACCQFNNQNKKCRIFRESSSPALATPTTITAQNGNKAAFMSTECPPVELLQHDLGFKITQHRGNKLEASGQQSPTHAPTTVGCVVQGMGNAKDNDDVYGCDEKDMLELWGHSNLEDRDAKRPNNHGIADCYAQAHKDARCDFRVEYHEDGLRCKCLQKGKWCRPKHKPSFTIADCDCGFRPGQLCSGGIQESVNNETQLECYQRCIHTENACCQFNNQNKKCRIFRESSSPALGTPTTITAQNGNKAAF